MSMRYLLLVILLLNSFCCLYCQPAVPPDSNFSSCLQKANSLLDEAFLFMQKNYYRKNEVQWDSLQQAARQRLNSSGNCNETYDVISWCFRELNEVHSFIMPPSKAAIYTNDATKLAQPVALSALVGEIKAGMVDEGIAYLSVPWVSTTDSLLCIRVADSLQQLIARLDAGRPRGWIIDLRKNTGGNCWPMLAGIGPLLGEGVCGYFISSREKIPISYGDGAARQGKHVRCQASTGYTLQSGKRPIIVLTGKKTVSSGEIVALAFKGREDVYFYGEPTAGYTTANASYTLSDNSMLVLSVCREADRNGVICTGSIVPDESFSAPNSGSHDPALAGAIMWLASQPTGSLKLAAPAVN
ncbi:MAG TPA: S41 family peptidase [Chitinophagaceae bacterium]|nr:S41 family peptidase [Chitinophagaceae bacterium]